MELFFKKKKKIGKKKIVEIKSFVAGALLKFDCIDVVDFKLLSEDFKRQTGTEFGGILDYALYDEGFENVYILVNGTIKLKDGVSLDFICRDGRKLRDRLAGIAGSIVCTYFENFDVPKYKGKKEAKLLENKRRAIQNANVLLISYHDEDYNALLKYGFKNVDYFKSAVIAENYFAMYPEEIEKYHIILKGYQLAYDWDYNGNFFSRVKRPIKSTDTVVTDLYQYSQGDYTAFLEGENRSWYAKGTTYDEIFDRILECVFISNTLSKDKKYAPIVETTSISPLPLPAKKSDLKILYLDNSIDSTIISERVASELGLNIDFETDDNYSLNDIIRSKLGDYDIIVATYSHSGVLPYISVESTEQCKKTGRGLTLLASKENDGLTDKVKIEYSFGGILKADPMVRRESFAILISDDSRNQANYYKTKGLMEAMVSIYNQALLDNGVPQISDLNFRTAEEYDSEYKTVSRLRREMRENELKPIREFDSMMIAVKSYLKDVREGAPKLTGGLTISENKNSIKLSAMNGENVICLITVPKFDSDENLREFDIQILNKNGTLSSVETIGLYTSEFNEVNNMPKRPSEKQMRALNAMQKRVEYYLTQGYGKQKRKA